MRFPADMGIGQLSNSGYRNPKQLGIDGLGVSVVVRDGVLSTPCQGLQKDRR